MTSCDATRDLERVLDGAFQRRREAGVALVGAADAVARACRAMADRFRGRGRLLAFGDGAAAADARHVAVEFLHPVIVGKRALPALALAGDVAAADARSTFVDALRLLGRRVDIAIGLSLDGCCPAVVGGLDEARARGLLAIALTGGTADAAVARAADHAIVLGQHDPLAVREALVTTYHVLWELVHVFLERPVEAARC